MSADIISLDSKRARPSNEITDPVYECPCGGQLFSLRPNGVIQCDSCMDPHVHILWSQHWVSPSGLVPK